MKPSRLSSGPARTAAPRYFIRFPIAGLLISALAAIIPGSRRQGKSSAGYISSFLNILVEFFLLL